MRLSFKFYPRLNCKQLVIMEELSFHTTRLYNIANYELRENSYKPYVETEKLFKSNWHTEYLHSHNYQHCLKILDQDWKSYFKAIKDYKNNPSKYIGKPKPPKFKNLDKKKNQVIFTKLAIRTTNNIIKLSLSKKVKSMFNVESLNF